MIDATSGFHQVRVDIEASKLLTIVTNMGCFSFTVMPQVVCNSSALWNILIDGNSRIDSELNILKNMDNFMPSYLSSFQNCCDPLQRHMDLL